MMPARRAEMRAEVVRLLLAAVIDMAKPEGQILSDIQQAVRILRLKPFVRRGAGIEEQDPLPFFHIRDVRMAEDNDIDTVIAESMEGDILRRSACPVPMNEADPDTASLNDFAAAEALHNIRTVIIPGDAVNRGQRLEYRDDAWRCPVSRMQDEINAAQPFDQRARQLLSPMGHMGIRHDSDAHRLSFLLFFSLK